MASVPSPLLSAHCLEKEYQKLVDSWTLELKNTHQENPGLQWSRLMDRYLDQQWSDSQVMLHHAQWSANEATQTAALFSLRMMKRSIDVRQEMIDMLCVLNTSRTQAPEPALFSTEDTNGTSHHYAVLPSSDDETQVQLDESVSHAPSSTSSNHDMSPFTIRSNLWSACSEKKSSRQPSVRNSIVTSRPFPPRLLAPSPSTPTFSTTCQTVTCRNNFTPLCNYNRYCRKNPATEKETTRLDVSQQTHLDANATRTTDSSADSEDGCRNRSDTLDGGNTCVMCHERLPFKKSFSVDDVEYMKAQGSDTTSSVGSSLLDFPMPIDTHAVEEEDKRSDTQLSRMEIDHIKSTRCSLLPRNELSTTAFDMREASLAMQPTLAYCATEAGGTFRSANLSSGRQYPISFTKRKAKQNFVLSSLSIKKVSSFTKLFTAKKSVSIPTVCQK